MTQCISKVDTHSSQLGHHQKDTEPVPSNSADNLGDRYCLCYTETHCNLQISTGIFQFYFSLVRKSMIVLFGIMFYHL